MLLTTNTSLTLHAFLTLLLTFLVCQFKSRYLLLFFPNNLPTAKLIHQECYCGTVSKYRVHTQHEITPTLIAGKWSLCNSNASFGIFLDLLFWTKMSASLVPIRLKHVWEEGKNSLNFNLWIALNIRFMSFGRLFNMCFE